MLVRNVGVHIANDLITHICHIDFLTIIGSTLALGLLVDEIQVLTLILGARFTHARVEGLLLLLMLSSLVLLLLAQVVFLLLHGLVIE